MATKNETETAEAVVFDGDWVSHLVSDKALDKAIVVENLKTLSDAWAAEEIRVAAEIARLSAGADALQAIYEKVVGILQITRKDCGDLAEKLDGRALKGDKAEAKKSAKS